MSFNGLTLAPQGRGGKGGNLPRGLSWRQWRESLKEPISGRDRGPKRKFTPGPKIGLGGPENSALDCTLNGPNFFYVSIFVFRLFQFL